MKKGSYWFSKLTPEQQENFKREYLNGFMFSNCPSEYFINFLEFEFARFKDFMHGAFYFGDTREGWDYWQKIATKKIK